MDWETHIALAGKLLDSCDLSIGGCIYSVLPAIDVKPLSYHRQYAHILANQTLILDVATEIYGTEEFKRRDFPTLMYITGINSIVLRNEGEKVGMSDVSKNEKRLARDKAYFYGRVAETAEGFVTKELDGVIKVLGEEAGNVSTDLLTAAVAIVSHTYFDMFNNPVSVFYPYAPNYAAHWSFWEEIDYIDFKETFYNMNQIVQFRNDICNSSVWVSKVDPTYEQNEIIRNRIKDEMDKPYNPYGMIKAMIERMGELAYGIDYDAVDRSLRDFLAFLGRKEVVHSDRERLFLQNIEREIKRLIYERYGVKGNG